MGNITPTLDHYPEMDRYEIPVLNLRCHVNPGNEYSIAWVQGCIRIHSQQPLNRLY